MRIKMMAVSIRSILSNAIEVGDSSSVGELLAVNGFAEVEAGQLGEALLHYAEAAPIAEADALSPVVTSYHDQAHGVEVEGQPLPFGLSFALPAVESSDIDDFDESSDGLSTGNDIDDLSDVDELGFDVDGLTDASLAGSEVSAIDPTPEFGVGIAEEVPHLDSGFSVDEWAEPSKPSSDAEPGDTSLNPVNLGPVIDEQAADFSGLEEAVDVADLDIDDVDVEFD